jgi:hypothetical protein
MHEVDCSGPAEQEVMPRTHGEWVQIYEGEEQGQSRLVYNQTLSDDDLVR